MQEAYRLLHIKDSIFCPILEGYPYHWMGYPLVVWTWMGGGPHQDLDGVGTPDLGQGYPIHRQGYPLSGSGWAYPIVGTWMG